MKHHFFMYNEEYKTCFNLFCAVTDRLESCIEYLNGHAETPKTEEDFLSFVMFSCMVLDAVKHVLKQLDIEKIDKIDYFQNICLSKPLNIENINARQTINFLNIYVLLCLPTHLKQIDQSFL